MRFPYLLFSLLLTSGYAAAADLPVTGISHVGFRVSDLEMARAFYTGVLGYEVAFEIKTPAGKVATAHFKVNDDQFIEISPNLTPDQDSRFTHMAFLTPDIERMRRALIERDLDPPPVRKGNDRDLGVSIKDPDGRRVEFMQYLPEGMHAGSRGKALGENRLSDRVHSIGITVAEGGKSPAFYRDKLGFGAGREYVEFGSMEYLCLEVPDIQAAYRKALARGVPADERSQPKLGPDHRWRMNLFDPDGTRFELMQFQVSGR